MADARREQGRQAQLERFRRGPSRLATAVLPERLRAAPAEDESDDGEDGVASQSVLRSAMAREQAYKTELLQQQDFAQQQEEEASAFEEERAAEETANVAAQAPGLAETASQRGMARLITQLWIWTVPSFGITFLLLDLLFMVRMFSKFLQRYIPGPGEEWVLAFGPPTISPEELKQRAFMLRYAEIILLGVVNLMIVGLLLMLTSFFGLVAYAATHKLEAIKIGLLALVDAIFN